MEKELCLLGCPELESGTQKTREDMDDLAGVEAILGWVTPFERLSLISGLPKFEIPSSLFLPTKFPKLLAVCELEDEGSDG